MISRVAIAVLIVAAASAAGPARASVQRCVGPDGQTIFTDRSCASLDARPANRIDSAGSPATIDDAGAVGGFAVRGCARTPEALRHGVRDALFARDVNRLANYYHWSGTGTSAATALMTRLERLVDGALGEVELLSAASRPPPAAPLPAVASVPAPATVASAWWRSPASPPPSSPDRAAPATGDVPAAPAAPAEPAAPGPPPVALRVAVASDGIGGRAAYATFGLRRNAGCWWIQY